MKSSKVVGKRIAKVVQGWVSTGRDPVYAVKALVLEDGTALLCHAVETEIEPLATLIVSSSKWPTKESE